jgi:hypothetical protein
MDWFYPRSPETFESSFPPSSPSKMSCTANEQVNVPASAQTSKFFGNHPSDRASRYVANHRNAIIEDARPD